MAASQTIDSHQSNMLVQRKAMENCKNTSDGADRAPSTDQQSQKTVSRLSAGAGAGAGAGAYHITGNSHNSNGAMFDGFRPSDDGNRCWSHRTASSMDRPKAQDCKLRRHASRSLPPAPLKGGLASSDHASTQLSSSKNPSALSNANTAPSLHRATETKLASRKLVRTSTQMGSIAESNSKNTKNLAASSHFRQSELCKDCKRAIMESVCFISNEGKITAGITHRLHYCKRPGCAANRNYHASASILSNKALVSKTETPPPTRPQRIKSKFVGQGDHRNGCSSNSPSAQEGDHDNGVLMVIKETSKTVPRSLEGHGASLFDDTNADMDACNGVPHHHQSTEDNASSPCEEKEVHADGFPEYSSENLRCSNGGGDLQSICSNIGTPAGSYISFDDARHDADHHDSDHEIGSVGRDKVADELHDFKTFCYHGDNEYSCSEDGTGATTTPNSLLKGAFDNLSKLDIEEEHPLESKELDQGRSSMARMRRRYLQSLREQEAEMVRLRKQEIMARKQAGEWMLDCHMEELLHKLAPNGAAHVKVLVEAFETVIHQSDSESSQTHHQEHNHEQEDQLDNIHSDASS